MLHVCAILTLLASVMAVPLYVVTTLRFSLLLFVFYLLVVVFPLAVATLALALLGS